MGLGTLVYIRCVTLSVAFAASIYLLHLIFLTYRDAHGVKGRDARMSALFQPLFHEGTAMGLIAVILSAAVIGILIAHERYDATGVARTINSIPWVRAAREACKQDPRACDASV
jgi:hypothetical protein